MMNKVVIRIEGGLVTGIYSTDPNLQTVIVDLDNTEGWDTCTSGILAPDSTFDDGKAYLMFAGSPMEIEASDDLKSFKF